jgi:hypothetical protein
VLRPSPGTDSFVISNGPNRSEPVGLWTPKRTQIADVYLNRGVRPAERPIIY